jgi:hypothetical protein
MSPAITSTTGRTFRCLACELNYGEHDCADYRAPVTQRSTVRVPAPALHEYLPFPGESDHYPSL